MLICLTNATRFVWVAYLPALRERWAKRESETSAGICRVTTLPADGWPHPGDQTRTPGPNARRVRHDEEEWLIYRKVGLDAVKAFTICYY